MSLQNSIHSIHEFANQLYKEDEEDITIQPYEDHKSDKRGQYEMKSGNHSNSESNNLNHIY